MISNIKDSSAQSIQQYQKSEMNKNEADKTVGTASAITETVDLSSRAQDIQQIKQVLSQTPDVREDKIRELKSQIESGNYTAQANIIANKMAEESLIDIFT